MSMTVKHREWHQKSKFILDSTKIVSEMDWLKQCYHNVPWSFILFGDHHGN